MRISARACIHTDIQNDAYTAHARRVKMTCMPTHLRKYKVYVQFECARTCGPPTRSPALRHAHFLRMTYTQIAMASIHAHMRTYMFVHIHMRARTHAHTHTHTNTRIHTCKCPTNTPRYATLVAAPAQLMQWSNATQISLAHTRAGSRSRAHTRVHERQYQRCQRPRKPRSKLLRQQNISVQHGGRVAASR